MIPHSGKRLFISGIPTAGKSYLARLLAKKVNGTAVLLDDYRESLSKNDTYKKWTDFYLNQDELKYLTDTSPDEQWANLVSQSEGLWPAFLKEIEKYRSETKPVIFECVNMLPHLVKRDLNFPGVVLIGTSFEETLKRNQRDPRWGDSPTLQDLEAKYFFYVERPRYQAEAKKYGYNVYETADKALTHCLQLVQ
jgi:2-phosphoglycerate kinase